MMRKYMLCMVLALLTISCNGQKHRQKESVERIEKQPKGSWKVDKEFDENGNLIRYDSIYTWSLNNNETNLSSIDRDSLLKSFKSKFFTNFSEFQAQGFEDVFSEDSLFSKHYFSNDFFKSNFGREFMEIDKIIKQMEDKQKKFLEKYQSEFINPK
ncbi:hypothetical protein ABMY20_00055 [Tenacibaculum sp. SSH1-16]|uniref:hypothetical protein n=1 Tax=Tenacibaculum sp. SSH1-16 TaxID=3136667 RepID=UPI0032C3D741